MLNVQKYLQNHTLEDLENSFGIKVSKYDDRVVLNYCQIDSPRFHPICDECRGLILSLPDYKVMCRSFDRFYNYGEGDLNKSIDISKCKVLSKEDGSLVNLYWDGYKWCLATRKMAFAEGETVTGKTFHQLFEKTIGMDLNTLANLAGFNHNFTWIFELCTQENRVVKQYSKPIVYLIGIRNNNIHGDYVYSDIFKYWKNFFEGVGVNIDIPKEYSFDTFENIMKSMDKLPTLDEGYICWHEPTGYRIKIKNPSYVAIHKLRDNGVLVPRRIVSLVHMNEHEEYLVYFPEDREFFNPYINAYEKFKESVYSVWESVKHIDNQKDFAMNVKDLPISGILFGLKKGLTLDKIFDNITDKKLTEMVEKYKE